MRISDWSSDVCSSDLAENESRKSDVGRDDPFSPALPPGLPVLSKTRFDFRDAAALRTRERGYDPLECCGLHRAELADVAVAAQPHLPVRWSIVHPGRAEPPEDHRHLVGCERALVVDERDEVLRIEDGGLVRKSDG